MSTPFENAVREFDEINGRDPRTQIVKGQNHPREQVFVRRVSDWVERLNPSASEAVRLAARSHTLRRWEIPRGDYRKGPAGYHEWRRATARHAADAATEILRETGIQEKTVQKVRGLITWELFPHDPDAQLLEDADCLAFLELKLTDYLGRWDEAQVHRILQGTWGKMSAAARRQALTLSLDQRVKEMIGRLGSSG